MDCDVNRETLGQPFKGTFLRPWKNWFAPHPGILLRYSCRCPKEHFGRELFIFSTQVKAQSRVCHATKVRFFFSCTDFKVLIEPNLLRIFAQSLK